MKFGIIVVFEKIFDTYVEGVKANVKVGERILSNISEITEDLEFLCKLMKMFLNDKFNGVCLKNLLKSHIFYNLLMIRPNKCQYIFLNIFL
mgnify:CR=1 FL=1